MTAPALPILLDSLIARGVRFAVAGDRLAFDAPRGLMTDGDRAALKEHKSALVALLRLRDFEAQRVAGAVLDPLVVMRAWRAAKAACPDCVVTLEGAVYARQCVPRDGYDPQAALDYADTADVTDAQRAYLSACAKAPRKAENGALLPPMLAAPTVTSGAPKIPVVGHNGPDFESDLPAPPRRGHQRPHRELLGVKIND